LAAIAYTFFISTAALVYPPCCSRMARILGKVSGHPETDLQFTHDRVRKAVLRAIGDHDRRLLHRNAAHAIGRTPGSADGYFLAFHLSRAGESKRAVCPALRAAERALRQHALDVAETNYRIASQAMKDSVGGTVIGVVSMKVWGAYT
jgi:hypothetical protein